MTCINWTVKVLCFLFTAAAISACGGDNPVIEQYAELISRPTGSGPYEESTRRITLRGDLSNYQGGSPSWKNEATGQEGVAVVTTQTKCGFAVFWWVCGDYSWWKAEIGLAPGENRIVVRFGGYYDSIIVLCKASPVIVFFKQPLDASVNNPLESAVRVSFSEAMDSATLTTDTFLLVDSGGNRVAGTVMTTWCHQGGCYDSSLTPLVPLKANATYKVIIKRQVRDFTGIELPRDFEAVFSTGLAIQEMATAPN